MDKARREAPTRGEQGPETETRGETGTPPPAPGFSICFPLGDLRIRTSIPSQLGLGQVHCHNPKTMGQWEMMTEQLGESFPRNSSKDDTSRINHCNGPSGKSQEWGLSSEHSRPLACFHPSSPLTLRTAPAHSPLKHLQAAVWPWARGRSRLWSPGTCHLEGEATVCPGASSLSAAAARPGAGWAMMDFAFLPLKDGAGLMQHVLPANNALLGFCA